MQIPHVSFTLSSRFHHKVRDKVAAILDKPFEHLDTKCLVRVSDTYNWPTGFKNFTKAEFARVADHMKRQYCRSKYAYYSNYNTEDPCSMAFFANCADTVIMVYVAESSCQIIVYPSQERHVTIPDEFLALLGLELKLCTHRLLKLREIGSNKWFFVPFDAPVTDGASAWFDPQAINKLAGYDERMQHTGLITHVPAPGTPVTIRDCIVGDDLDHMVAMSLPKSVRDRIVFITSEIRNVDYHRRALERQLEEFLTTPSHEEE
jgi:hypothetical protein